MASLKTVIAEKAQEHIDEANWTAAISEMERLFAIHKDPLIRVRIGNARRKLNREDEAIQEYLRAADLFAEMGFLMKARAQYRLALKLDPSHADTRSKMEQLPAVCHPVQRNHEAAEYRPVEQPGNAMPTQ